MNAELNSRHPIEELAEEFVERFRRGERPSLLEYCDRCPELADEIRDLFPTLLLMERHNSSSAGGEFHRPSTLATSAQLPEHVADFRIVREIGRGGMGVVYEAEQRMLGRRVALKILTLAASSNPNSLHRFEREARAAARLQHPHIVPVYDVGVVDGLHYYAMQFIEGCGLDVVLRDIRQRDMASTLAGHFSASTRAADEDRTGGAMPGATAPHPEPSISAEHGARSTAIEKPTGDPMQVGVSNECLAFDIFDPSAAPAKFWTNVARLGLQAAQALAHAHEQGIVHRDIKPSNLLLDKRGLLWITDFGLAKTKDAAELTQTGDIVGTLRYMAPEQFRGWSDPRTDVHGLGLTLYELLTLRPAYDALSRAHLLRQITDQAPAQPTHWNRRIPRDLETIVLKALEKEPSHRYQSAAEMAEDLQRFLDDRPIVACRASMREHFWRWCRRNPVVAALTLSLLFAFVIGFMGVFWQWRRAERNLVEVQRQTGIAQTQLAETDRQTARAENNLTDAKKQRALADASFHQARAVLAELFATVGEESELDEPSLQPLRKKLLGTLLEYDRGFVEQRGNDPTMQAELATSFVRMASISSRAGLRAEAIAASQKAVEIRQKLIADNPGNLQFQADLAGMLSGMGVMHHERGDLEESRASYEKSIAIWERVLNKDPKHAAYRQGLAIVNKNLGYLFRADLGRQAEAWPLYEKSLEILKQVAAEQPQSNECQYNLAFLYGNLGRFKSDIGSHDEAIDHTTKSQEILEELVRRRPDSLIYQQKLASVFNLLGDVHRHRRHGNWEHAAWEAYEQAKVIQERLVGEFPQIASLQTDVVNTYINIGDVHRNVADRDRSAENWRDAIRSYQQGIATSARLQERGNDSVELLIGVSNAYYRQGWCQAELGERDGTIAAYQTAIDRYRAAIKKAPSVVRYSRELSDVYLSLAAAKRLLGLPHESVVAALESRTLSPADPDRLYGAAREIALAASSLGAGKPEPSNDELAARTRYADQAIGLLQEAMAAGFSNLNRLRNDESLAVLRKHSEYKSLIEPASRKIALAKLDQAIAAQPEYAANYVNRAKLYEQLARVDLATADFRQAIELYTRQLQTSPEHFESRFQRGHLYLRLRDYELAVLDFRQALERNPNSLQLSQIMESLAEAHLRLGQAEQVIAEYSRIIEIEPKNVTAHIGRLWLYKRTKQHEKAIADYHRIIELKPADPITYNGLAWIHIMGPADLRSPAAALPFAEKAVALAPKNGYYRGTLGSVWHRLGEWNKSIETMQQVIASSKSGATAFEFYFMAMSHHKLGDTVNAIECYRLGNAWLKNQTNLTAYWVEEIQALRAETELELAIVPTSTAVNGDSPRRCL